MSPGVQALLSGTLTLGVPLLLAIRELIVLNRDRGGPGNRGDGKDKHPDPSPDDEPALPPLPPCLVPREPAANPLAARGTRTRVLEDA